MKSFNSNHLCRRIYTNPRASSRFLADYFLRRLKQKPDLRIKDLRQFAKEELRLDVSIAKCKRVKKLIKNELAGNFMKQFTMLQAYATEVKRCNPGSACDIQLYTEGVCQGKRIFWRMFICF